MNEKQNLSVAVANLAFFVGTSIIILCLVLLAKTANFIFVLAIIGIILMASSFYSIMFLVFKNIPQVNKSKGDKP